MTPAVTAVVATRNRRELLEATVRSILGQRDADVRVVVVDDASTEDVASSPVFADPRVVLLRNDERRGAAASRNRGIAAAETPWVAFCDDDDLWAPTKLAEQFAAIDAEEGARWAATGAAAVDAAFQVLGASAPPAGDILDLMLVRNQVTSSSLLVAASLVEEAGPFREDLLWSEDWDFAIRLASRSPLAVAPRPLLAVRTWEGSKSRRTDRMEMAYDHIQAVHAELVKERGVPNDRAGHQRYLAKQELRDGRRLAASCRFLALARHERNPALAVRAAAALLAPRTMDRVGTARRRRSIPPELIASAEAWIGEVRRGVSA